MCSPVLEGVGAIEQDRCQVQSIQSSVIWSTDSSQSQTGGKQVHDAAKRKAYLQMEGDILESFSTVSLLYKSIFSLRENIQHPLLEIQLVTYKAVNSGMTVVTKWQCSHDRVLIWVVVPTHAVGAFLHSPLKSLHAGLLLKTP